MPTLFETLSAAPKRAAVIADSMTLLDQEVDSKGGISGIAIKAGYKLVKSFKPGFVPEVIDALLEDFCRNLQPLVDDARAQGKAIAPFFVANRGRVADALLAITDTRAQRSKHGAIKAAYDKLRGMAKKQVEEAVPRVGALIEKHAG